MGYFSSNLKEKVVLDVASLGLAVGRHCELCVLSGSGCCDDVEGKLGRSGIGCG